MRVVADISLDEFVGAVVDRYIQPLLIKVEQMSQQIIDLQNAVAALTTNVTAAIANETALKQKLDAAIAENASLSAQLATAQANAADPADAAAIAAISETLGQQSQALADATALTSPAN